MRQKLSEEQKKEKRREADSRKEFFRPSDDLRDKLNHYSDENDVSKNQVIIDALNLFFKQKCYKIAR